MAAAQTRIKLEFNTGAANLVEYFSLDSETLSRAQVWQAKQQQPPDPRELADWLLKNGGKLDRSDGPAAILTEKDVLRREEWYSQGLFDRGDGPP
jgi:hypothetical protein